MLTQRRLPWIVPSCFLLLGCTEARPIHDDSREVITWEDPIQSLVAARCSSCHSGAAPAGGYATTTYSGVLGPGQHSTPNAVAGDPSSRLLVVLGTTDPASPHAGMQDSLALFQPWVVKYRLAYFRSSIHAGGILDPSQPDFHGKLNQTECKRCHGQDLAGGPAGVSCQTCHAPGATGCASCHARVVATEPHRTHVSGGGLGKAYPCATCHQVTSPLTDPNHGSSAGLTFANVPGGSQVAGAIWDPVTLTCTNVYCHHPRASDQAALLPAPTWTPSTIVQCGSCHGVPPNDGLHLPGTAIRDCARCHPSTIDRAGILITQPVDGGAGPNHLNGIVNVP